MNEEIAAMAGRPKDDFIRRWGVPTKCAALTSGELCEWIVDLGTRGGGVAVPIGNAGYGVVRRTRNTFEKISAEFDSSGNEVTGSAQVQY